MLERLKEAKIPIRAKEVKKERLQSVSPLLSSLLVKYPDMQPLARRAFITYLEAISKEKDKETFDVMKLLIDEFSASMGLPITPKIRFVNRKSVGQGSSKVEPTVELDESAAETLLDSPATGLNKSDEDESDNDLLGEGNLPEAKPAITEIKDVVPATRVLKKKKLKIIPHRPLGTRVVFDEEGNVLPPLATIADRSNNDRSTVNLDKVQERYQKVREMLKQEDKVDKIHARQLLKEKRMKQKLKLKLKLKRGRSEEEDDASESGEETLSRANKKSKVYFDSDSDVEREDEKEIKIDTKNVSLAEQEDLALKLRSSMHP